MKKKVIETITITPTVLKPLDEKLRAAVQKVLLEYKTELTDKIEKVINNSIRKIVKKTDKQIKKALKSKK